MSHRLLSPPWKVIVAGSRSFSDYRMMEQALLYYLSRCDLSLVEIVSGTARGADQLGERFAQEHGCAIKRFPADWARYGKRAGLIRNEEMAKYADACVCFWDGKSRGTKHMIDVAREYRLWLRVVRF
ncbi:DUF2493 domain-containing protein [Geobacillus subterraneus]|uniref:YspA cpYpsA-related SLOG domain-containing protein n=1 Tax=Geobacillus subterraneus TaxID=129338 RepID=A0A679FW05_9BACL|nr:DUF2493 domain-containing protein [Geobacillus subterraneus]BBW98885.1 hypothetical protein GsuE55_37180 [Geobacillus subterraneus]